MTTRGNTIYTKCLVCCHRKSFTNDSDYWSFAKNELFKKIGGRSFAFESDPSGTLLGGSHVFATARDWARFGQLYLQVSHPAQACQADGQDRLPSCSRMQALFGSLI